MTNYASMTVSLVILVIFGLLWLAGKFIVAREKRTLNAQVQLAVAEERWQEAARLYKDAISLALESRGEIEGLVQSLSDVYTRQGLTVDLVPIRRSYGILQELLGSKLNPKEQERLLRDLTEKARSHLSSLP